MGIAFGMLSAFMTKYMRSLTKSAPLETFLMFFIMMGSYICGDMAIGAGAGVIALITCGLMMT
jgi:NhaP-type Na+/H+ or K+/H+ antiporter